MAISEKTKINLSFATVIACAIFISFAAYAVGIKQASMEKDIVGQSKDIKGQAVIIQKHIQECTLQSHEDSEFRSKVIDRLARIEVIQLYIKEKVE